MNNLTPKIDDALGALIELLNLKKDARGFYSTRWGKKTTEGLKLSIISKLREYGVELYDESCEPKGTSKKQMKYGVHRGETLFPLLVAEVAKRCVSGVGSLIVKS